MFEKRCIRCGEAKPVTREFFGSTPSGGLRGYCRNCMNKASFKYEANNKDAHRERDAKRARAAEGDQCVPDRLLHGVLGRAVEGQAVDDGANDNAPPHKLADGVTHVAVVSAQSVVCAD